MGLASGTHHGMALIWRLIESYANAFGKKQLPNYCIFEKTGENREVID
jgi:hypothetical protein